MSILYGKTNANDKGMNIVSNEQIQVNNSTNSDSKNLTISGIPYTTDVPTSNYSPTESLFRFVVLYESQKASITQYEGYWYIFVQDPSNPQ